MRGGSGDSNTVTKSLASSGTPPRAGEADASGGAIDATLNPAAPCASNCIRDNTVRPSQPRLPPALRSDAEEGAGRPAPSVQLLHLEQLDLEHESRVRWY